MIRKDIGARAGLRALIGRSLYPRPTANSTLIFPGLLELPFILLHLHFFVRMYLYRLPLRYGIVVARIHTCCLIHQPSLK